MKSDLRPQQVSLPGAPPDVRIWEVGPRDGLQNESSIVPTEVKREFVERLVGAGLAIVETTSFVHPDWVPQLADAAELMAALPSRAGVRFPVLVPNERGLARAIASGASDIAVFASATESFARRNLNCGFEEQFDMFEPVVAQAQSRGLGVRGYLSMCFGDPWEGAVPIDQVVRAASSLMELGCDELSLGDTIGVATPGHVRELVHCLVDAGIGVSVLGVHFHDTYGQGLANTLSSLEAGVTTVDASAGGLGGCPYAESATGNLATEDLVWMLDGLGVRTGVQLEPLLDTSVWLAGVLGRPSPSRVVMAQRGRA